MERLLKHERIQNDVYQEEIKKKDRKLINSELKISSLLNKNYELMKNNLKMRCENTRLSNDLSRLNKKFTKLKDTLRMNVYENIKINLIYTDFYKMEYEVNKFEYIFELIQNNNIDMKNKILLYNSNNLNTSLRYFDYGIQNDDTIYIIYKSEYCFSELDTNIMEDGSSIKSYLSFISE